VLEAPERAVLVDGGAALVNVPTPARFAFHKLLVAPLRPAAFQTKSQKDVTQACQILELLVDERPGDLALAWQALRARGPRWERAATRGLALVGRHAPELQSRVAPLLSGAAAKKRRSRSR
jgi:hypothetical protein